MEINYTQLEDIEGNYRRDVDRAEEVANQEAQRFVGQELRTVDADNDYAETLRKVVKVEFGLDVDGYTKFKFTCDDGVEYNEEGEPDPFW